MSVPDVSLILSSITWAKLMRFRSSPDHGLLAQPPCPHTRLGIPAVHKSKAVLVRVPHCWDGTFQPQLLLHLVALMGHPTGKSLIHHSPRHPESLRHAQIIPVLHRSSISSAFHLKTLHRDLQISLHWLHHQVVPICKVCQPPPLAFRPVVKISNCLGQRGWRPLFYQVCFL